MEKFKFAMQVVTLGLGVVMFALAALYGTILLFGRIFQQKPKPEAGGKMPETGEAIPLPLVAAMVACCMAEDDSFAPGRVTVVAESTGKGYSWSAAGRKELLANRAMLEALRRNKVK